MAPPFAGLGLPEQALIGIRYVSQSLGLGMAIKLSCMYKIIITMSSKMGSPHLR